MGVLPPAEGLVKGDWLSHFRAPRLGLACSPGATSYYIGSCRLSSP